MSNPYEYLGVSRNATEKDIMDAYRRIAGEITNSSIPDSEKTQRMNELNNAYDTILNDLRGTTNYAGNQNSNNNNYSQFFFGTFFWFLCLANKEKEMRNLKYTIKYIKIYKNEPF